MAKKISGEKKNNKSIEESSTKVGRPTKYSKALAEEICIAIAITSMGLNRLCAIYPTLPSPSTIFSWLTKYKEFSEQYARAKSLQAEVLADEIIDISDDGSNDLFFDDDGNAITNHDVIARSRLRVDARKWLASKLAPKVYGDRVQNEVTLISHEQALKELAKHE